MVEPWSSQGLRLHPRAWAGPLGLLLCYYVGRVVGGPRVTPYSQNIKPLGLLPCYRVSRIVALWSSRSSRGLDPKS
ncbi:MAG: hypothetical protein ACO2OZ_01560 [Acidilobaceae archaeon]